jgi:SAM-dependent methyltransferase
MPDSRVDVSPANAAFWNELCGTQLAVQLGVADNSPASLKKFDDWYFAFYPYLDRHIPFSEVSGRRVLEVGLGYGTVSQRLAECGAIYTGLDIAQGPVSMVNYRLSLIGNTGEALCGSILEAPFADNSFDFVVAIGCFHHTGNLELAIEQSRRVLKPGGRLHLMVYNAYSYRRWLNEPRPTSRYFLWDKLSIGKPNGSSERARAAYDTNSQGQAAPHTDFVSRQHLRRICRNFSAFRSRLENIDQEGPFRSRPREHWLKGWPRYVGLDIYATAQK